MRHQLVLKSAMLLEHRGEGTISWWYLSVRRFFFNTSKHLYVTFIFSEHLNLTEWWYILYIWYSIFYMGFLNLQYKHITSRYTYDKHFLWPAAVVGTTAEWSEVSKLFCPACSNPGYASHVGSCEVTICSLILTNTGFRIIYEMFDLKSLTDCMRHWRI